MPLTISGALGWRHAFVDTPTATYTLAGGTGFTIVGSPAASDVLTLNAGFMLDLSEATTIDLSYGLLLGESAESHALKGTWLMRF